MDSHRSAIILCLINMQIVNQLDRYLLKKFVLDLFGPFGGGDRAVQ